MSFLWHEPTAKDKEKKLITTSKLGKSLEHISTRRSQPLGGAAGVTMAAISSQVRPNLGPFFSTVKCLSSFSNKAEKIRREIQDSWD